MARRWVQDQPPGAVRRCLSTIVCVAAMAAVTRAADAPNTLKTSSDWEGRRANSILLNGDWEFSPGDGSEQAETSEGASRLRWKAVTLPGSVVEYRDPAAAGIRFAWVRRSFSVSAAQAERLAVLR